MMGLAATDLHCENADALLFTENESNLERLWGVPNRSPFVKDSINDAVTQNKIELINPEKVGTKAAAHYRFLISPNESRTIRLRLRRIDNHPSPGDSVVPLSPTHSSALTGASRPSLPAGERGGQHDSSMTSMKSLPRAKRSRRILCATRAG